MSLKVWLPLNGELKNLGNGEITFSGTQTWQNYGKIGNKAYNLSTKTSFNCPSLANVKYFSVAFWGLIEPNAESTANWMDVLSLTDKSTNNATGHFRFETGYGSATYGGIHWHDNSTNAIINGSYTYNTASEQNQWHHIVVTVSDTAVCSYYDGVLKQTHTTNLNGGSLTGEGWIGESTTRGGIQDVRIYDHCLSAAEVHEIAQGLILHYKLDGPIGGSGINLLRGSNKIGNSNNYGWVKNGSFTNFSMEKLEGNIIHYKGTISNSKNIPSITTNTAIACKFGETYTYQMELKLDKDIKLLTSTPMHFWAGCRTTDNITNVSCNGNLTGVTYLYVQNHSGTLAANTWAKIITRITFPSSASSSDYSYPAIRAFVYGAVLPEAYTGEVNVWMRNCKIEKGIEATSWTPALEDLGIDTSIITDSSGYNYNGKITDTVEIISDARRYNISANFIDNTSGLQISTMPMGIFNNGNTIAFWIKPNGENGQRSVYCSSYSGMSYSIEKTASNKLRIWWGGSPDLYASSLTILDNEWQHIVIVKLENKLGLKLYKNGEYIETLTSTLSDKDWNGTYRIGRDARTDATSYIGQMSDFRIYCTPLLDNDVKLLYNTSMRIDKLNQLHTFEFLESDNEQLTKKGVLKTNELKEQDNTMVKLKKEQGWIASNFIEM